mgnify:CR=1 FL=1
MKFMKKRNGSKKLIIIRLAMMKNLYSVKIRSGLILKLRKLDRELVSKKLSQLAMIT